MKRLLIIFGAALALTGCGGTSGDLVRVAEAALDENTSTAKGVTAGLSSSDAANVLMNRDYYNTVKAVATGGASKAERIPSLEIEAHDGRPIVIDAKVFRMYHAPQQQPLYAGGGGLTLKAPPTIESTGIKWFREGKEALVETLQTVLPWKMVREEGKTRRHESDNNRDVRLGELEIMNSAVRGAYSLGDRAITTFRPLVVHSTAPQAPAEPETPAVPTE